MSIIKKSSFPLHLDVFKAFIVDNNASSTYFNVTKINDTLSGGKNSFSIQGSRYLKEGSYIFVEIKDSTGAIIYTEPAGGNPTDYYEGVTKPVSVHVYEDTPFGEATLTIVGELKEYVDNGIVRPVPPEWAGKINVKWQKKLTVNPFLENTNTIRLYKRPDINITEKLLNIYERQNLQLSYNGYFRAVAINPPDGTNYPYNGPIRYEVVSINPTSASFTSPVPTGLTLVNAPAVPFKRDSIGASLFTTNLYLQTGEIANPNSWQPKIIELIDPYRAIVEVPYVTNRTGSINSQIRNISYGEWNSTYELSTINVSNLSSSYASIDVSNLETFSGDIYRLKVFAKSRNDLKGFFLLEDIVLENNELFQTEFFLGDLNRRTGLFKVQNLSTDNSIIYNFWASQSLDGNGTANVSQNDYLVDSVLLEPDSEPANSTGVFRFYYDRNIPFIRNAEYVLNYTPLFYSSQFSNDGLLDIYATGSAFSDSIPDSNFGKKIASLSGESFRRFERQSINFKADYNGSGSISFVVRKGNWELGDISLKAAAQTAFNPNKLTFLTKPNIQIPSESFDFRFELFDINYTYVPVVLEKTIRFGGGNDIVPRIDIQANPSILTALPNPPAPPIPDALSIFTISPTAVSASPAFIEITASLNVVTSPIIFDSGSFTAYDRDGDPITANDIIPGNPYPGSVTQISSNNSQFGNRDDVRGIVTYENFKSALKSKNGLPRDVGYIVYNVYQQNNTSLATTKFAIGTDWSNYLGCAEAVISNVTSVIGTNGIQFYPTASNWNCTQAPNSEFVLWVRPSGSNDWYWGGPFGVNDTTPINTLYTSASGNGPFNGSPWFNCSSATQTFNTGFPTSQNYRWLDFRISKRCFDGAVKVDNSANFFRFISSPDLQFSNFIYQGGLVPFVTNPLTLTPVPQDQGPSQFAQFGFTGRNFRPGSVTAPNGLIRVFNSGIGNQRFEIAVSSSTPTWVSALSIPYQNYGTSIPDRILVRTKGGLPSGSYNTILTAFADYPAAGGNPAGEDETFISLPVSGTVGPPGAQFTAKYVWSSQTADWSMNCSIRTLLREKVGSTYVTRFTYVTDVGTKGFGEPNEFNITPGSILLEAGKQWRVEYTFIGPTSSPPGLYPLPASSGEKNIRATMQINSSEEILILPTVAGAGGGQNYEMFSQNLPTPPGNTYLLRLTAVYPPPPSPSGGPSGGQGGETCCFMPGTLISMADGSYKKIEELQVGDSIISYNEVTHTNCITQIPLIYSPIRNDIYEYFLDDGTSFKTTQDHPIYVKDYGWASLNPELTMKFHQIRVNQIANGDILKHIYDKVVKIIDIKPLNIEHKVYTFTTNNNDARTYYANGILAHNKSRDPVPSDGWGSGLLDPALNTQLQTVAC